MEQVRGHGQEREPCEAGLQGWAGWAEVPTPVPCQALALEWAKDHEGEREGEVSSQAKQ